MKSQRRRGRAEIGQPAPRGAHRTRKAAVAWPTFLAAVAEIEAAQNRRVLLEARIIPAFLNKGRTHDSFVVVDARSIADQHNQRCIDLERHLDSLLGSVWAGDAESIDAIPDDWREQLRERWRDTLQILEDPQTQRGLAEAYGEGWEDRLEALKSDVLAWMDRVQAICELRRALAWIESKESGFTDESFDLKTKHEIIPADKQETVPIKQHRQAKSRQDSNQQPAADRSLSTPAQEAELLERAARIAQARVEPLAERLSDAKGPELVRALGLFALRAAQVEVIKEAQRELVDEARSLGATWSDIAGVSGTSEQAAHRRWNPEARKRATEYTRERYYRQRGGGKIASPGAPTSGSSTKKARRSKPRRES